MKLLIVGSGGREHALAWKLQESSRVNQIFVAPGNAGTAREPKVKNINIGASDISRLHDFAHKEGINLTIVGPEAPLAAGIVDRFEQSSLACLGPTQKAAQLESSKVFSKKFMQDHGIPTAEYACFNDIKAAKNYVREHKLPLVIKADGLAAGKGVIIAHTSTEADAALQTLMESEAFQLAGSQIIVEECLSGEEASFVVLTDGEHILPLATSQDHKARDNGDHGPNTGGMGAYSPAPIITPALHEQIMNTVIIPTIQGMEKAGAPYRGFLYAGLMISAEQQIKVLEFNCRLGDPETQPTLMRLQSDLATLCLATVNGELAQHEAQWDPRPALGVVLTAAGYPLNYQTGQKISGLAHTSTESNVKVFHAGTREENQTLLTNGGRVLCVTALANTLQQAQSLAYANTRLIHWPDMYYRTDIGYRAISKAHFAGTPS